MADSRTEAVNTQDEGRACCSAKKKDSNQALMWLCQKVTGTN